MDSTHSTLSLSTISPISISLSASQFSPAAFTSWPKKASTESIGNKREGKQSNDIKDKQRRKRTWKHYSVTLQGNVLPTNIRVEPISRSFSGYMDYGYRRFPRFQTSGQSPPSILRLLRTKCEVFFYKPLQARRSSHSRGKATMYGCILYRTQQIKIPQRMQV